MSRYLFVVLADDLAAHLQTRTGVFRLIELIHGVESVTDIDAVSRETLDAIMRKPASDGTKKRTQTARKG